MKAMILAAGAGTRLRPITNTIPKALAVVQGKTMLERIVQKLVLVGVDEVIVNAHHFWDQIDGFVNSHDWGVPVSVIVETEPGLETAGGVANVAHLLEGDEPVLLHNVDVLSSIPLKEMISFQTEHDTYATLAIRVPANTRPFLINENGFVVGHRNKLKGTELLISNNIHTKEVNFCGIHVVSQSMIRHLAENPKQWIGKSLTEYYLSLISTHQIRTFDASPSLWLDIGTPGKLAYANTLEQNIDFLS